MIIRELIYSALWELGASAAGFASANRRLRHWADVAPGEQPALFMSEKGGQATVRKLGALRRFRSFGQLPGKNKLKAGGRLLV
jgi:hypothetical protein